MAVRGKQVVVRHLAGLLIFAGCALAQPVEPAHWSAAPVSAAPGGKALLRAVAQIDAGWHLYAPSSPSGIPASFQVGPASLVERVRVFQPAPKKAFDPVANANAETYVNEAAFLLEVTIRKEAPAGASELALAVRYQTCSDTRCVPGKWAGTVALQVDPATPPSPAIPAGYAEAVASKTSPSGAAQADGGWVAFVLVAFGFGLASIFTPCVFPMIPITMSYFLNRQSDSRRDGVVQAVVFCLGIVVLFTSLGLAASAILGPAGVKNLGSSPWVNGFIAALFIAFGLSLLGAFEITIPSPILTRLNQSSNAGGFIGTLLMGLTFALSSFACVGPFVGTLLAGSVQAGALRPLVGMAVFATGLALPFFLLALFPSYLKRLPKSGGWLARVKMVMGFAILAFSLKYLASLDQTLQWGLLPRERFLAVWVVLFSMAGLYLLGFLRLEGVKPDEPLGLGRLLIGMAFLVFALSLAPGMFGGNLGYLEAFVPMASAQSGSAGGASGGLVWMKDQYREALDRARREGKLVFVDFTGYNCANCHWMRGNILNQPEIVAELKNFVLLELYTDGVDAASDANSKLQQEKFGTVTEPFYVILDPDERLIAKFDGLTHDRAAYLAFLRTRPAAATNAIGPFAKLDGTPFDSASLAGKVVVIDFWATYCVPCIAELPVLNNVSREIGPKGLAMVGVDMDEDASGVPAFLKKHPIEYSVAVGSADTWKQYKIDGLPVTLVLDRTGKLVKRFDGGTADADLRAAIEKAFD
jgi:thiol:disulfide interchange protein DsbD